MKYREYNQSKIVILPDSLRQRCRGVRPAPQAILDASNALFLYDHETDSEVFLTWYLYLAAASMPGIPNGHGDRRPAAGRASFPG